MQVYKNETERLKSVKSFVKSNYPYFGINKKQQLIRLLYEISKREDIMAADIVKKGAKQDYHSVKKCLLEKRFPNSFSQGRDFRPYLPKMELKKKEESVLKKKAFSPKNIFIEKPVCDSYFAKHLKTFFPKAHFSQIISIKDYRINHKTFGIEDYNKRRDALFVVKEGHDFFKRCPCTKGAQNCGYHVFNLGFGCIFECTYCFLQGYANSLGVILPANVEGFFDNFNYYKKPNMRIGTGEFSDSLALDWLTRYSMPIIDFFRKHKDTVFEFKTKSNAVGNLLKAKHAGNIVVSWSLNPQCIIDENEFFTSALQERLDAALKCINAGYKVGFHFDPVIYFSDWEKEYGKLTEMLFEKIKPKDIAWISIGTFRFAPLLKQVIEKRFIFNKILDEELLLGYDDKLRYPFKLRYDMYKRIIQMLSVYSDSLKIYLCMEESSMWRKLNLKMPKLP